MLLEKVIYITFARNRKEKLVYVSEHYEEMSVFQRGREVECFVSNEVTKQNTNLVTETAKSTELGVRRLRVVRQESNDGAMFF